MTLALLGAGQTARAGHWELKEPVATGKTTWPAQNVFNPGDNGYYGGRHGEYLLSSSIDSLKTEGGLSSFNTGNGSTKRGIALTRKVVGSGTASFEWIAKGYRDVPDNSTPPPYLFVRVTANASGSASTSVNSGQNATIRPDSVTLTVSNGYESAVIDDVTSQDEEYRSMSGNITSSKLIMIETNGRTLVPVPLPSLNIVATAHNDIFSYEYRNSTAYYSVGAWVSTGGGISIKQEGRGVAIASDIEKSYKKVTSELALPQKMNASNNLVIDTAKIGSQTPYNGFNSGPWSVECEREADGSMNVVSAAVWQESSPQLASQSIAEGWRGHLSLEARSEGYTQPQYAWTLPTTLTNHKEDNYRVVIAQGIENVSGTASTDFSEHLGDGTEAWATGGKSSPISVQVSESGSPTLSGSYGVNWHLPFEPYHQRETLHQFNWRRSLSDIDDGAYFGHTDGNVESESNPYWTSNQTGIPLAEAVLDGVTIFSSVLPKGKEIASILTKLGTKGLDWYKETEFPAEARHFTNVAEVWTFSQQHQLHGNSEGPDPSGIADLVPDDLMSDPDGWTKCTHQVFEIVHSRRESWDADVYNKHGFQTDKGIVNSNETLDVSVEVKFTRARP